MVCGRLCTFKVPGERTTIHTYANTMPTKNNRNNDIHEISQ